MVMANFPDINKNEALQAELAAAASRVAGQKDRNGAFIDAEMDLWYVLQARQRRTTFSGSGSDRGVSS
jgi:hypothetical protein